MKTWISIAVGAALLTGCGLRGDLERPAPIIGEATDEAPEAELVDESRPFGDEPAADRGPKFNELGGEIPEASPSEPVDEEGLPPPSKPQ